MLLEIHVDCCLGSFTSPQLFTDADHVTTAVPRLSLYHSNAQRAIKFAVAMICRLAHAASLVWGAFLFNSLGRVWAGVLDMGVQIATKFALIL